MNRSTSHLDGDDRVEKADGSFEWFEVSVLIGEHAKGALTNAQTNTGVDVFFGGLEPGITLGLIRKA